MYKSRPEQDMFALPDRSATPAITSSTSGAAHTSSPSPPKERKQVGRQTASDMKDEKAKIARAYKSTIDFTKVNRQAAVIIELGIPVKADAGHVRCPVSSLHFAR